jgi:hypothetical protein
MLKEGAANVAADRLHLAGIYRILYLHRRIAFVLRVNLRPGASRHLLRPGSRKYTLWSAVLSTLTMRRTANFWLPFRAHYWFLATRPTDAPP